MSRRPDVLVADDDPIIRQGYGLRMRAMGWNVTLAKDGYEALSMAREQHFDVVLLDLRMPYRTGADVLEALRREEALADAMVYLLALPGDGDLAEQAMRAGADGIFEKTRVSARDIVTELETLLETRAAGPATPAESVSDAVAQIARRFRSGGRDADDVRARTRSEIRTRGRSSLTGDPRRSYDDAPTRARRSVTGDELRQSVSDHRSTRRAPGPFPAVDRRPGASPFDRARQQPARSRSATDPRESVREETEQLFVHRSGADAPARTFDTVINRFVGEARRLADQLGLPPDFLCPVCGTQLVLRLSPDRDDPGGVRGHFVCSRCSAG